MTDDEIMEAMAKAYDESGFGYCTVGGIMAAFEVIEPFLTEVRTVLAPFAEAAANLDEKHEDDYPASP